MKKITMVSAVFGLGITLVGCNTVENSNIHTQNLAAKNQPIQNQDIKIYNSGSKPKSYKVIGRVASENYNMVGMTISQNVIMQDLKTKAIRLGANAIMNVSTNLTQTTADAIVVKK